MSKFRVFTTFVVIALFSASFVYADGNKSRTEELIDKHQSIIDKAKVKDWKTYADCANDLVSMRICNEEILSWINKSIEIKETIFNRTVKGDFLLLAGEYKNAKKEYVKAISLAQKSGKKNVIPDLQWKILIAMGVENYDNFHAAQK
mgnify:FL=1|jgi:hypothetical protein